MRRNRLASGFNRAILRLRGWDHRAALAELEELQWAPLEQVRELQLRKLRRLLAYCWDRSPWYRARLEDAGLGPERIARIAGAEDLVGLPVIDKHTLRAHYDEIVVPNGPPADIWVSSGSTGMPFPFRVDKRAIAIQRAAAGARFWRWWGYDDGVRQAMIWSGISDVSGSLRGRLLALRRRVSWRLKNICLVDVYSLDLESIRVAYDRLARFRPVVLRCIASGLFRFCVGLEELGLDGRRIGAELAIYTGEGLPPLQRELVQRILGCRIASEYGCTEVGPIALECPEGGMHLSHECLLIEFLKGGRERASGEHAELIVTALEEYAAPLVRYAVGDLVVPSNEACPCGRTMPLIRSVEGRTQDTVRTPDGDRIHFLFFTHLFDDLPSVHQFRVVQETLQHLRIELWSTDSVPHSDRDLVRERVQRRVGDDVEVSVEQVSELPISPAGKLQWVLSKVQDG